MVLFMAKNWKLFHPTNDPHTHGSVSKKSQKSKGEEPVLPPEVAALIKEESYAQEQQIRQEKLNKMVENSNICGVIFNQNQTNDTFPLLSPLTGNIVYQRIHTSWKNKPHGNVTREQHEYVTPEQHEWCYDFAKTVYIIAELHKELRENKEIDENFLQMKFRDSILNQKNLFLTIMEYNANCMISKPVYKTVIKYIKGNPNWISSADKQLEIYTAHMLPIIQKKYQGAQHELVECSFSTSTDIDAVTTTSTGSTKTAETEIETEIEMLKIGESTD
jgi:hypothetical protein